MPVVVDPVNETLSTPGCSVSHGPSSSSPLSAWTTPGGGGKKLCASSASLSPESGVIGLVWSAVACMASGSTHDGFMMIGFPATRAGPSLKVARKS